MLIGALAAILGIGGIAAKIQKFFKALTKPVGRAVDFVIDKIAALGKKLWAKLKARLARKKGRGKDGKDRDAARDRTDVRAVARRAAQSGWKAAERRSATQVLPASGLEAALRTVEGTRGGVRIKLDIVETGDTWRVRAQASKGSKQATAEEGRGWVARTERGEPRYAARDLSGFNRSLIDEAFAEMRGASGDSKDAGDLRASYTAKVEAGRRIERTMQDRLNSRIRGLRFTVEPEPYAGAQKDKKLRTTVRATPNEQKDTGEVPLEGETFPYKIGQAQAPIKTTRVGRAKQFLRKLRIPMRGNDPSTGFVVNMAAQPGEVQGNMAARYLDEGWEGSGAEDMAATRTAVVTGVNTFERLDPAKNEEAKGDLTSAVQGVDQPPKLRMAVFGFLWTPTWVHLEKGPVPLAEVRRAYNALQDDGDRADALKLESGWREGKKLPYGIFREEVLGSSYTQKAVELLSAVNQQVHILSQDADTGVTTAGGRGVLAEYDSVLKKMGSHPLLTIGGYTFEGFDWGELAESRTAQLTTLANALDRAIRVAIAERHPEMLYPTEPNMLIKAWDRSRRDGIFQDAKIRAELASSPGSFYGIGAAEGRHARNRMMEAAGGGFSVAYTPTASTVTSPAPGVPGRGLTVTPEDVHEIASGERFDKPEHARRRHPAYATIIQSQSFASAETLAREFRKANPALASGDQTLLHNVIFVHVEEVFKLMADNPELTVTSPEIRQRLAQLDSDVVDAANTARVRQRPESRQALDKAHEVTQQIITAMTASGLKDVWGRLHQLLDDIMQAPRPSQGGPR